MKIYCKITCELFGFINFEKSTILKSINSDCDIKYNGGYCYALPHRIFHYIGCVSDVNKGFRFYAKEKTQIFWLFWILTIVHIKKAP